jgi:hypothetical protein
MGDRAGSALGSDESETNLGRGFDGNLATIRTRFRWDLGFGSGGAGWGGGEGDASGGRRTERRGEWCLICGWDLGEDGFCSRGTGRGYVLEVILSIYIVDFLCFI